MSDYISAFDWEINFIPPQEHLNGLDLTPSYAELMHDREQTPWNDRPVIEWPNGA